MKKLISLSLSPLLVLSPLVLVSACATTEQNPNPTIDPALSAAVNQLNNNPPSLIKAYQQGIPEGEFDYYVNKNYPSRLLEKLIFARNDQLTYAITDEKGDFDLDQSADNPNLGKIYFKIELTNAQNQKLKTDLFSLDYQKVPFKSASLKTQKARINQGLGPNDVQLKPDLPIFDPSTTAFYNASATHPNVDFAKWKDTVYQKFIPIESNLITKVLSFSTVASKVNPQNHLISLDLVYYDPTTKEYWNGPAINVGNVQVHQEVNPVVNKTIWQLLNQNQVWILKANHDAQLNAQNILANTNFDDLKDHWMVSKSIDYQVNEFKLNNDQKTVQFKLQINPTISTDLLTFKLSN